jgi:hypothetical protein
MEVTYMTDVDATGDPEDAIFRTTPPLKDVALAKYVLIIIGK